MDEKNFWRFRLILVLIVFIIELLVPFAYEEYYYTDNKEFYIVGMLVNYSSRYGFDPGLLIYLPLILIGAIYSLGYGTYYLIRGDFYYFLEFMFYLMDIIPGLWILFPLLCGVISSLLTRKAIKSSEKVKKSTTILAKFGVIFQVFCLCLMFFLYSIPYVTGWMGRIVLISPFFVLPLYVLQILFTFELPKFKALDFKQDVNKNWEFPKFYVIIAYLGVYGICLGILMVYSGISLFIYGPFFFVKSYFGSVSILGLIFGVISILVGACISTGGYFILIYSNKKEELESITKKEDLERPKKKEEVLEPPKKTEVVDITKKKEKEKKLSEEQKTIQLREKDQLQTIPNLQNLLSKFIYVQFREMGKQLSEINSAQVDSFIRNALKKKSYLFYEAMDALGHRFSPYQQNILLEMIYAESEPIRRDLQELLSRREEEARMRKEREDAMRKLEEQRRKTAAAFGEEITTIETVEKVEPMKPLKEEIDKLLKGYETAEKTGKEKKE